MNKAKAAHHNVSYLRSHVGFWLRFVSNHVSYAFARKLEATGVTVAEWVILREMFDRPAMPPSALAEFTGLTRGAVSKLVDRLYEKKLLTRQESTDDRRYQEIALTDAGRRLVPELALRADQNDEEFFAALSAREREQLVAVLKKIVQAHGLSKVPID
jgi:DNA-binding MarR family transcriptional regulator